MRPDLNDTDLERHLRRRADSARLRNDWARIELLPVVRTAVESRPEPLTASRLSPLAGIAAVAAVVVLLVVALPRMVPAPGATTEPSPSADPGLVVLSTQEFRARLATGDLVGSTVLVEGRIVQYEGPVDAIGCSPLDDSPCFMGQLDGVQQLLGVTTRYVAVPEGEGEPQGYGPEGWSWWHLPAPPVEGILVLSVQGDGPVEYMGRVKPASDGLTWSASEASEVDLESLALDEIVLVDGWLTGLGGLISGQPPQPGTFIGGLPQRYSGNPAWVLDARVVLDPDGYREPEGGIRVQNGAYYEFAPNPALVDASSPTLEPRRAKYLLTRRLEGGGCPGDAPPCLQWNVVGHLTPDSPQDPPNTPEPSVRLPSPATSPPPNPRTITCGRIVALPGRLGTPSPPEGSPTVTDQTGLITSCFASGSLLNQDGPPLTVSNPDPDRDQLSVTWLGSPCDIQTTFTFRRSGDSYELTGDRPEVDCEQSLVRHGIEISLSQPISSSSVAASVPSNTTTGPPTTPTLVPSSRTLECPYETGEDRPVEVAIVDHTGRIAECHAFAYMGRADDFVSVTSESQDNLAVQVQWHIGGLCSLMPVALEFWDVGPHQRRSIDMDRVLPNYVLQVDRLEPTLSVGCRPALSTQGVLVTLTEPIAADDIEAFVTRGATGTDWFYESEDEFVLTLASDAEEYLANEQIVISASITYSGPSLSVAISDDPVIAHFGFEQLDGDLELPPGPTILPCVGHGNLQIDVPRAYDYRLPESWPPEHPDAAFFEHYTRDGKLTLPAGTYRIYASASFSIGDTCTRDGIDLRTSIVIRVR